MEQVKRKLIIHIKGSAQIVWTNFVLKTRLKLAGINIHRLKHHALDHTELVVSGDETKLWQAVKLSKKPLFFVRLDQVSFHFVD